MGSLEFPPDQNLEIFLIHEKFWGEAHNPEVVGSNPTPAILF